MVNRKDWLIARQKGIGGSDVPALLIPDFKWKTPYDVWKSKVEPIDEEEKSSLSCRTGTFLEPFIVKLFNEETGLRTRVTNKHYVHSQYSFMVGNIDRKIIGEKMGLECKSTAFNHERCIRDENGKIVKDENGNSLKIATFTDTDYPAEYFCQMQHYLAVTGWDKWYLAVLIGNRDFKVYEVARDEEFIKFMIEKEIEFWNLVETKTNIWE